jgi:hypothetical protein
MTDHVILKLSYHMTKYLAQPPQGWVLPIGGFQHLKLSPKVHFLHSARASSIMQGQSSIIRFCDCSFFPANLQFGTDHRFQKASVKIKKEKSLEPSSSAGLASFLRSNKAELCS